jgi:hypothetical protein
LVPSGLKITVAALVTFAGLVSAAVIGLRDANRRPDYCAQCHVTEHNVDTWISSDYLAFTHAEYAISCQRCHERSIGQLVQEVYHTIRNDYELPVKQVGITGEDCMRCHGDWERVAQLTEGLPRNPHDSPHGQQDCLDCHAVHQASVDRCAECHERTVVGPGWTTAQ